MSCVVMQGCSPGSMLTRSRMSCKVFSFRKAQLVQEKVTYLGYEISGRQRSLGTERKEAICQMPRPETVRDLRAFLVAAAVVEHICPRKRLFEIMLK
ncbi:uncharacterized protein LOC126646879 isoform X3 [Myiozetetes cayanensis]|uniref:uncharacterized protein LOC126646879 isoform X3 n=1 Tax=Myiozetetes cayanensis TaxID=478635 RepID=UPI00215FA1CE|nr:uncharacterized protein LOC126646879 isoform X3 [Myiozetetes cayanensis]